MKGILLSFVCLVVFFIFSVFALRAYRGIKYYLVFLMEVPFVAFLYLFLFTSLPENLYFLPSFLLEPSRIADFLNGFLILVLLFHLAWDMAYAMILTGFSSEVAVKLFRGRKGGLSVEALMKEFGADREMDDILTWRIPNLLKSGFLRKEGDAFCLTRKGKRIAAFALFLKRLFKMDVEG